MSHPKPIKGGRQPRYAAISPKMFTHAIVVAPMHDRYSIHDNYCYHGYAKAKAALDAWDGTGEPTGWHRHSRVAAGSANHRMKLTKTAIGSAPSG